LASISFSLKLRILSYICIRKSSMKNSKEEFTCETLSIFRTGANFSKAWDEHLLHFSECFYTLVSMLSDPIHVFLGDIARFSTDPNIFCADKGPSFCWFHWLRMRTFDRWGLSSPVDLQDLPTRQHLEQFWRVVHNLVSWSPTPPQSSDKTRNTKHKTQMVKVSSFW
jgi:hypothetical protein